MVDAQDNTPPPKVLFSKCTYVTSDLKEECGRGDSAPMKIYAPSFLVADIRQESDWVRKRERERERARARAKDRKKRERAREQEREKEGDRERD